MWNKKLYIGQVKFPSGRKAWMNLRSSTDLTGLGILHLFFWYHLRCHSLSYGKQLYARYTNLNILYGRIHKRIREWTFLHLFCCFLERMISEKRRKSEKAGFNLNLDVLKALSYNHDFGCRETTSDFVGFEKVGKAKWNRWLFSQHQSKKRSISKRKKASPSTLVKNGTMAVGLGI